MGASEAPAGAARPSSVTLLGLQSLNRRSGKPGAMPDTPQPGACAGLAAALLHFSGGLRILATSREALGVSGELTWPVPPLSFPDAHALPPVEELGGIKSVRLFVERARYSGRTLCSTP